MPFVEVRTRWTDVNVREGKGVRYPRVLLSHLRYSLSNIGDKDRAFDDMREFRDVRRQRKRPFRERDNAQRYDEHSP